jgi:hypothetical protein
MKVFYRLPLGKNESFNWSRSPDSGHKCEPFVCSAIGGWSETPITNESDKQCWRVTEEGNGKLSRSLLARAVCLWTVNMIGPSHESVKRDWTIGNDKCTSQVEFASGSHFPWVETHSRGTPKCSRVPNPKQRRGEISNLYIPQFCETHSKIWTDSDRVDKLWRGTLAVFKARDSLFMVRQNARGDDRFIRAIQIITPNLRLKVAPSRNRSWSGNTENGLGLSGRSE